MAGEVGDWVSDLSPPWILFTDQGRPVAILPAGRPGEVANVEHLTMEEAKTIVGLANQLAHALQMAKMNYVIRELDRLSDQLGVKRAEVEEQPLLLEGEDDEDRS